MSIVAVGLDLAKHVFQLHGVDERGEVVLRRPLRRDGVERFFRELPACVVGLEACASAHDWARRIACFGHTVRLIPPTRVKAYAPRGKKNDATDAAAIAEAVMRPQMSFVPIKNEDQPAVLMLHRTRDRWCGSRVRHDCRARPSQSQGADGGSRGGVISRRSPVRPCARSSDKSRPATAGSRRWRR
jgi:transposase